MQSRHTRPRGAHARGRARIDADRIGAVVARATVVALAVILVGGSTGPDPVDEPVEPPAAIQARLTELTHRHRSEGAQADRLEAVAVGFAAVRRSEALVVARAAVQSAAAVAAGTPVEVPAESVLDAEAARLVALIDATPPAPPAPGPAQQPAAPEGAAPGSSAPARSDAVASDAVRSDAVASDAVRSDAVASDAAAPRAPAPAPGPATSAPAPDPTSAAAPPTDVTPATGPAPGPAAAPAPRPPLSDAPSRDLAASAEVLAAAQRVTVLSEEVRVAAEAAAAAAAAAAVERAAAEEAARAVVTELERAVDAADAAPNGEIPLGVLCAPAAAPDALLRCDAAAAFDRLAAAYRTETGRRLDVVSAYRSFDQQVAVKAARGGLAATPGRSNHGRALAVDLGGFGGVGQFTAPGYLWMKEHAGAFGWHHPVYMEPGGSGPQEPWHWEYGTDDTSPLTGRPNPRAGASAAGPGARVGATAGAREKADARAAADPGPDTGAGAPAEAGAGTGAEHEAGTGG